MPRFLLAAAALAIGFSLGWLAHAPTGRPVTRLAPVEPSGPATAADDAGVPPGPTLALAAQPADSRDEHHTRIGTLKWLRESGSPVRLQVFHGAEFNESLTKILGLSAAEKTRLTQAAQSARNQLDAARAATAIPRQSPDGTSLVVDVPALDVAASGTIYDQFRDTLQSTLGPERLDLFDELAGDAFERSFDRFGLNAVRYEITPPRALDSSQILFLEYKRHFIDATGSSAGSTSNRLVPGEIEKTDGLLAKLLPPEFNARQARP